MLYTVPIGILFPVALVGPSCLRCCAREPHLQLGHPARRYACCCKRSDQLSQGAARLLNAPRDPLSPEVDAAGGDSLDPERPGFVSVNGAIRQMPPADAQRAAGNRFRQVAIGLDVPAAVGPVGSAGL